MKVSGTCDVRSGTVSKPSNTHLKPLQPSCTCNLAPPVIQTQRTGHKLNAELAVRATSLLKTATFLKEAGETFEL